MHRHLKDGACRSMGSKDGHSLSRTLQAIQRNPGDFAVAMQHVLRSLDVLAQETRVAPAIFERTVSKRQQVCAPGHLGSGSRCGDMTE